MINIIFPFIDFTYILQLEDYSSHRYIQQLFNPLYIKFIKRNLQKHDSLTYTKKAILIITLSLIIFIASIILIFLNNENLFLNFLLIFILTVSIPIIILIANILSSFTRIFYILEIIKARKKIQSLDNLKIIAITGSYGKTTTKNIIYEFIKYNYTTQYIENNINTPIGIANWINKKLKKETEILIIEMGAYNRGVIKKSVSIAPPDYAIITELGDQHIERFGSFENLIQAKLEIFSFLETKKYILDNVFRKIKKEISPKNLFLVDLNNTLSSYIGEIPDNHFQGNIALSIVVAQELNIPKDFIFDSIKKLKIPQRRKNIIKIDNFDVLDDSYNISLNTAKLSLKWAHDYCKDANKKLIVITAGIPETGINYREINTKFGLIISKYTSDLFVLNSVFKRYILEGYIGKAKHADSNRDAMDIIKRTYSHKEYVVLTLPELTDLHY